MANEQKLKENNKNLKIENERLSDRVKELEKNAPLLTKSGDKVAELELKLEASEEKVTNLSREVNDGNTTIKGMRGEISSLEKKVGKVSGEFPKLPTGATFLTEMSLSEDETLQLWDVKTKGGSDVTLQIGLKNGKAAHAEFTVK